MNENELREMIKVMCGRAYEYEGEGNRNLKRYALNLANAGYRKIHDGGVMLSKEEYEALMNDLINVECNINHITLNLDEARKETAMEILQTIKTRITANKDNEILLFVLGGIVRDIVKQYGVEEEE